MSRQTVVVGSVLAAFGCVAGVVLVPSAALASWLLIIGGAAILVAILAVLAE